MPGLKVELDARLPGRIADRRHIQQAVEPGHLLLNELSYGVFYRLGRSARIVRGDCRSREAQWGDIEQLAAGKLTAQPSTMMPMAMTHANTGRSRKNLDMGARSLVGRHGKLVSRSLPRLSGRLLILHCMHGHSHLYPVAALDNHLIGRIQPCVH